MAASWLLDNVVVNEDAEGPVQLATDVDGNQWITYWSRGEDAHKAARVVFPTGGGGGEGGGEGPILPALELQGQNPLTRDGLITLSLRLDEPECVSLALFDISGRRVAEREPSMVGSGRQVIQWRPEAERAGVYFLRVRIGERVAIERRLVVLR